MCCSMKKSAREGAKAENVAGFCREEEKGSPPFDGFCLERSFVKAHAEEMKGMWRIWDGLGGPAGLTLL